ncbi:methyltransferase domain-containing protein [Streptomyces buecherae]|uniref:methyltransferase domain-containing protein n=1 Tax=Streptomyces buecherae TaxID=2763006 RepID=UPI0036C5C74A
MTADDYTPLCQRLAESLAARGLFTEPWLRAAFDRVPRHLFVPETVWTFRDGRWRPLRRADAPRQWAERVYHRDDALVTQVDDGAVAADGSGLVPTSSLSSPAAVLNMLASLAPRPGDRTLEIGTGTGYNAALLCHRVGGDSVTTVEVDRSLADRARTVLRQAGYTPEVICADGERGHPERAPYDRVISTASVRRVPAAWLEQTRAGGEIVTPWLPNDQALGLLWLRKGAAGGARGWFHGGETFMALRGQRRPRPDVAALWSATRDRAEETGEKPDLSALTSVHARFALAAALPGVSCIRQGAAGEWFLLSADHTSWAWVRQGAAQRFGARDLLREVEDALRWWSSVGRPPLTDFGMSVAPDGRHTLWLGSPSGPAWALPHC